MLSRHAHEDGDLQAAAQALASPAGSNLGGGGGGAMAPGRGKRRGGEGGASDQGGAGGGGAGGWVHLSDVSLCVSVLACWFVGLLVCLSGWLAGLLTSG